MTNNWPYKTAEKLAYMPKGTKGSFPALAAVPLSEPVEQMNPVEWRAALAVRLEWMALRDGLSVDSAREMIVDRLESLNPLTHLDEAKTMFDLMLALMETPEIREQVQFQATQGALVLPEDGKVKHRPSAVPEIEATTLEVWLDFVAVNQES